MARWHVQSQIADTYELWRDFKRWKYLPKLPLKRIARSLSQYPFGYGELEVGFALAEEVMEGLVIVHLENIVIGGKSEDMLTYTDLEAMIEDGWIVD
jgi:hypothetical protein